MLSCLKLKCVNRLISYVPESVSKFPNSDMTSRSWWWSTRTTHGRTQSLPRSCVPTPRGDPARQSPGLMAWPAKPTPTFRKPSPSPLPYRTSSSCVCGVHIPWLPLSSRCSAVQGGRMRVQDDTFTKVRIRTWIKWRPLWIKIENCEKTLESIWGLMHLYQGCHVCFSTTKDLDHTTCIPGKSSDILSS